MVKKLTYEEVKAYIEGKEGNGCKLLSEKYINAKSEMSFKCKCGDIFYTDLDRFKSRNKRQCTDCGIKNRSAIRKLSYNQVKEYIDGGSGNGCKLLSNEYENNSRKLNIMCKCGSKFEVSFGQFKDKNQKQCPVCGYKSGGDKHKHSIEEILIYIKENTELSIINLNENYNPYQKLEFVCKCGEMVPQTFRTLKKNVDRGGKGECNSCLRKRLSSNLTLSVATVKKYIDTNGNGASLVSKEYKGSKDKLKIKCSCGEYFNVSFSKFKSGQIKCKTCTGTKSRGEHRVENFLLKKQISYKNQYWFRNLRSSIKKERSRVLCFDFAITNKRGLLECLIEFDGGQHYQSIKYFGGQKAFERQQQNDQIKNQYCKDNNIPLIRIPYYHFDYIEDILEYELGKLGLI